MVPSSVGAVALIPFPFSDLSQTRRRPAVVLADVGRGDWVLRQVTSNAYSDARAIPLEDADFASGNLRISSFARPGKPFTASDALIVREVGVLNDSAFQRIIDAVVAIFQSPSTP